jgi:hypothetical protein
MPVTARGRAIAHHTRYLVRDLGPFVSSNCIARCDRYPADHGDSIPGCVQRNRDPAELVALRRRERSSLRQSGRVPCDRPSQTCNRSGNPDRPGGWSGDASHPPFPWLSVSSSIVDTGIELSCSTRLLPMPVELNGDALWPPNSGCLGYTLRDTLSRTARIEKPQKSYAFGRLASRPIPSAS